MKTSWNEIKDALKILNKRNNNYAMFINLSSHSPSRVGLNIIGELKERFKITVGFSDHYSGAEAGIAAAALGAEVIEKHITFSKKMYGSDVSNAMELDEFRKYISSIKGYLVNDKKNPVNKDDLESRRYEKNL